MSGAGLAGGFPDLSGLPAARRLHGGRWLAAALILLALAALARAFAQARQVLAQAAGDYVQAVHTRSFPNPK